MLNKLLAFVRQYDMLKSGDRVICAVSGGADSVALLFAMYLLADKLQISVEAAHFNHHLRGQESVRDEEFVRDFCGRYDIPLHFGGGTVVTGKKGLEAAAREARYAYLRSLPGKIATAHTADDNAETLLMHLVRGTGLRGLGGINPVRENLIRPMLTVTRDDVLAFLNEYHLNWVEDSTNGEDAFLRNRLRHSVMPFLKQENPKLAENLSQTALRLRLEEDALDSQIPDELPSVFELRDMHPGIRARVLAKFLRSSGISEPESCHIAEVEKLVFSQRPSARADLPGGVVICRDYDRLQLFQHCDDPLKYELSCPGSLNMENLGIRIVVRRTQDRCLETNRFTVCASGNVILRSRMPGDTIKLSGGTKNLKKLYIDRKIPAYLRNLIPVIADDHGVLGVYGIGANLSRISGEPPYLEIFFEQI